MTLFPIIPASDCEVMRLKTEERDDDDTGGGPCLSMFPGHRTAITNIVSGVHHRSIHAYLPPAQL